MRETLLGKLVLVLSQATPEELAAVYRFATGEALSGTEQSPAVASLKQEKGKGSVAAAPKAGSAWVFRKRGKQYEVIFDGGTPFRLRNTLGARYLDYLLHDPNKPARAFDLEVAVQPEKGEARAIDSIQPGSDSQALRAYRQELGRLQAQRAEAQAAGAREQVKRLDPQIAALQLALRGDGDGPDTGERARDNVRKAVAVVMEQLWEGGPEERAFAEHLRTHLSLGHECLYSHPQGRIWG